MLDLLIVSELLKQPLEMREVLLEIPTVEEVVEEVVEEPIIEEVVEEPILTDYRQTYYSVEQGETGIGYHGLTLSSPLIKSIDNVMHYNDVEYGWLPIIAVDMNEVTSSGMTETGTYNYYGSVYTVNYEDGTSMDAIVLDSCGACMRHDRIDLWVYNNDQDHDKEVDSAYLKRYGFNEEEQDGDC